MNLRTSRIALLAAVLSLSLLTACSDSPGGPEVRCVTAEVLQNGSAVDGVSVRAPALLGSVVEKSSVRLDDVKVTLRATTEDVTVATEGGAALEKIVTLDDVEAGYYGASSPLEAQGRSGTTYQIELTSACSRSLP
jgi:hypothetical protein